MSVELFSISPVGKDRYALSFRTSGRAVTYVVRVADEPFSGVSAPNSFWNFLQASKVGTQRVVHAVLQMRRMGTVSLPLTLPFEADEFGVGATSEAPLWGGRSASWMVSRESAEWAAKHLVRTRSNTLFPIPFEHHVINERFDDFRPTIQAIDLYAHEFKHYRTMQAPKASSGKRIATQLDPLDSALFSAIAFEVGEQVEAARIPASEGVVYSFRFLPDSRGNLWDESTSYESFQRRTHSVLTGESVSWIAEADISSFYHRVSARQVGASLERAGVNGRVAQAVTNLLSSYSAGGLPVGPGASALFAESVLSATDWDLLGQGLRFARFNDDYRFFCRSEKEGRNAIRILAESLSRSTGLSLHRKNKTRYLSRDDYLEKVKPDGWLEQLREAVQEAMYEDELVTTSVDAKLIASARSVFQQSIGDDHPAWVRLCKAAFSALPLEEKRAVLPLLLDKLESVWSVSPQVCKSIQEMLGTGLAVGNIVELVTRELGEQAATLPDYAATWLLHPFHVEGWPKKETLSKLDAAFGSSLKSARRELLIALKGTGAAGKIRFDPTDPWQTRARVWATQTWKGKPPDAEDGVRQRWTLALYDALANPAIDR